MEEIRERVEEILNKRGMPYAHREAGTNEILALLPKPTVRVKCQICLGTGIKTVVGGVGVTEYCSCTDEGMTEHTSLELSRRLYDKGFRGNNSHVWIVTDGAIKSPGAKWECKPTSIFLPNDIPAYTFTELWKVAGILKRPHLMQHLLVNIHRNDLAELAGEWLIDEGLYTKGGEKDG